MNQNPNMQPYTQPPVRQPVGSAYKTEMMSLRTAGFFAMIGILLFFVGLIILQASAFIQIKSLDDMTFYRNLIGFSQIISYIGILLITLPLYLTGITNGNLDWKVRATMVSSATAIIIATMIITMFAASMSSSMSMASYYSMSSFL